MRVLVLGWYGHGNVGDESFKDAFCHIWPEHTFTFTDNASIFKGQTFDLCILGGGDVVNYVNIDQFRHFDCPKIALGVTITANSLSTALYLLDAIYCRDTASLAHLRSYLPDNFRIGLLSDLSLTLGGDQARGNQLVKDLFAASGSQQYENVYAFVGNGHLMAGPTTARKESNYHQMMVDEFSQLCDDTNASFLFLPFCTAPPWDDRTHNAMIAAGCKYYQKNCVVWNTLAVQDTLDIIAACQMTIVTRFHGLIFSICGKVPAVVLSFHDKTAGFCQMINYPYLDYYDISTKSFKDVLPDGFKTNSGYSRAVSDAHQIKYEYRQKIHYLHG